MSKIRLHGSSSGYTEIAPPAAGSSATVTLPNSAGEILLSDGSAASLTSIPAANIVGVCTSGLTKTGGFGGITLADSWRVSSSFSPSSGQNTITANWERDDFRFEKIGDGLSESSGIFTFPETGKYLFHWNHSAYDTDDRAYVGVIALLSIDNGGAYATIAETYDSMHDPSSSSSFSAGAMTIIIDVTDTSQFKLKWNTSLSANVNFDANTNQQRTGFSVIRIGDT